MGSLVVDPSALVAWITAEPGHQWIADQLADAVDRLMSAPSAVELGIVLAARTPAATDMGRRAIRDARISIVAFDEELADRAIVAWQRFGKGRHPAGLNFGESCTFAVAEQTGLPILCTGSDFAQTDLTVLRPPDSAG